MWLISCDCGKICSSIWLYTIQLSWSVLSYRQTAEWGMRELQGSFGWLWIPLRAEMDQQADLIEVCFRLHNLQTRLVGISQIKNVYVPIWREGQGEQVWEGFERPFFANQRKHDHVSRFHIQEEWYWSPYTFDSWLDLILNRIVDRQMNGEELDREMRALRKSNEWRGVGWSEKIAKKLKWATKSWVCQIERKSPCAMRN